MKRNFLKSVIAQNSITVTSKKQFNVLLDELLMKESFLVPSVEISVDFTGNYRVHYELVRVSMSRVYKHANIISAKTRNGSAVVDVNKFSWSFVNLSLQQNNEDIRRQAENIFGGELLLVQKENGWVDIYCSLLNTTKYSNMFTNKEATLEEIKATGDVHSYRGLSWTASNKRQLTDICMETTDSDDRFKVLDNATLGAVSELYGQYYGKETECFEKIQKAWGYVGNVITPSVSFGKVRGFIRVFKKLENYTDEAFLSEACEEARQEYLNAARSNAENVEELRTILSNLLIQKGVIKAETFDGAIVVNAEEMQRMLKEDCGIDVDIKVLIGLLLQVRPATIKASALIVSKRVFDLMICGLNNMLDIEDWQVIGDENRILFIADANAIKLNFDAKKAIIEEKLTFEVLAHAKSNNSKLSKQLAETILEVAYEVGEDGAKIIYDLLDSTIAEKFNKRLFERSSRVVTPEEIESAINSNYIQDVLFALNPKLPLQDKALFNSVVRQTLNSVVNNIDGLNADINAISMRLVSDPTFLITGGKLSGILNFGEVFINDRRIKTIVMIKYPKMGLREFYYGKNVTYSGLRKRLSYHVKRKTISQDEANGIYDAFSNMDKVLLVLPAKSVIAKACAGLDFDYDGASVLLGVATPKTALEIATNKIVDMFGKVNMKAVCIDTSDYRKVTLPEKLMEIYNKTLSFFGLKTHK